MNTTFKFNMYEDKDLPDTSEIDWLDTALKVAQHIIEILTQDERRLPESGNGAVLKTDDTFA